MELAVGDRVLYAKYSGQEVPNYVMGVDEEEHIVLRESDILAKVA